MVSYNDKDDVVFTDNYITAISGRTIYSELTEGVYLNIPQYSLEAYATNARNDYTIQMQNNMLLPICSHPDALRAIHKHLKRDIDNDYIAIVERYIINNTNDMEGLINYYTTMSLKCVANTKENSETSYSIRKRLYANKLPIEIKILHLVDFSKVHGAKKVYLPNLNMVVYNGTLNTSRDMHPLEFTIGDIAPKLNNPDGVNQTLIKIVDNQHPEKIYYSKVFGNVTRIQSVPNKLEDSCIKIIRLIDNIEIEKKVIKGLDKLKDFGIYDSFIECEDDCSIERKLEFKKLELSLEKIEMERSKNLLEHNVTLKKYRLEENKIKIEYVKLDNDLLKMAAELRLTGLKIRTSDLTTKTAKTTNTINNTNSILGIGGNLLKLVSSTINLLG